MASGNYSYNQRSNPGNAAPYSQMSQPRHRRQEIDVRQLLQQEMRNQIGATESHSGGVLPGSASSSNDTYVGPYTDLKYGISDQYIYFDSADKVEGSDFALGKIVFNLQETNFKCNRDANRRLFYAGDSASGHAPPIFLLPTFDDPR